MMKGLVFFEKTVVSVEESRGVSVKTWLYSAHSLIKLSARN